MQFGFFNDAESLGYDSVWVTDSQMIFSDCYAVLALAARQTRRIRLGPGTAICGTRIPPVHVAAMATLNRLAPGRVHLGIGTGNTAMRTMGQRPMRIAEYDEYLRVLAALLRGETVDYRYHDRVRPIRMLTNNKKYLGLEPKIPLYVSGFGPRAMELAGKHGDGLVFAIPPRGVAVAEALGHAREGAARAGRALDGFRSCALTNVALLEPGEPVDSPRVVRTVGPNVMASVYYFYDEVQERGHLSAPRGSRADRRQPHPRHLPGRHGRGAGRASPRARASGTSRIDVRHRRRREMARGRGVRARGHRAGVTISRRLGTCQVAGPRPPTRERRILVFPPRPLLHSRRMLGLTEATRWRLTTTSHRSI